MQTPCLYFLLCLALLPQEHTDCSYDAGQEVWLGLWTVTRGVQLNDENLDRNYKNCLKYPQTFASAVGPCTLVLLP